MCQTLSSVIFKGNRIKEMEKLQKSFLMDVIVKF